MRSPIWASRRSARQVWGWTARGAAGYEAMTNLRARSAGELEATVPFSTLTVERQRESRDETVNTLFRTATVIRSRPY